MIALCASLLILCTASFSQATDERIREHLEQPKPTEQTQQSNNEQQTTIEIDEDQIRQFAILITGLQALANKNGVNLDAKDFVDTVQWKAFAKHYGITTTPAEFCAHLMQTKNSDAQWALFCQKHGIAPSITPTELTQGLIETLKNKGDSYLKLATRGLPTFAIIGAGAGIGGTGYVIKKYIYDKLTVNEQTSVKKHALKSAKDGARSTVIKIAKLLPKGANLIIKVKGGTDKAYTVKGIPLTTRNQLIIDVLAKSISEIAEYEFEKTNEHNPQSINCIDKFTSPQAAIKKNKTSPHSKKEHGLDSVFLVGNNLVENVIENVGNHAIAKTEDKKLLTCKNGQIVLMRKHQLGHVAKKSTQQLVASRILSQLSSNKHKQNDDTSKLNFIPSAKEVGTVIALNTTNEVVYNILAQTGHKYAPDYLPEDGQPKNALQAQIKGYLTQHLASFVLIPGCKLIATGIKWIAIEALIKCFGVPLL